MSDADGFYFVVSGELGKPPYTLVTNDGRAFWLPESIILMNGETNRECLERNLEAGRVLPFGVWPQ